MQGLPFYALPRAATAAVITLAALFPTGKASALSPLLFSLYAQAGETAAAQNSPAIPTLEAGKPVERELTANQGQAHSYQVSMAENQYASVIVEQRGIDVVVKCFGPDGKLVADIDSENRLNGEERAELVAKTSGAYRFDIEPRYKMLPGGHYQIRLGESRPATESDRALQEAREFYTKSYNAIVDGKYDEAQSAIEKVLAIREKIIGPDHPDIAFALTLEANIAYYKGDLGKAETLFQRAIAMLEKTLGTDHPQVAMRLNNLASVYTVKSDLVKAEMLHKRALEIREHSLSPDHPDIAQSLNNLGNVYLELGDFQSPEPLYLRAIAINEKILGPDHINLSYPLQNLAQIYQEREDDERAKRFLERALAIREQKLGKDHPTVAVVVQNLGELYKNRGDYAKAEELFKRSIEIREKKFGPDHPETAHSLDGLGDLYFLRGQYPQSESFYRRALKIEETAWGNEHPETLKTANKLARLYMVTGDLTQAVVFQRRAISGTEHNIDLNLAIGSERQKYAYLATLPEQLAEAISLHVGFAANDPSARDLASTTILRRKGRVLDAVSGSFETLRQHSSPENKKLLDQLGNATAQLAKLTLNGPGKLSAGEYHQQLASLEEQREELEAAISERSAEFRAHAQPVTLSSVRAAIPPDAALVEFAAYAAFNPKGRTDAEINGENHYAAYVLRPRGEVAWKELGPAKSIDAAIAAFRESLKDPHRNDVHQRARTLDAMIMQPIRPLIGSTKQLLISPDGELNLIPFEALLDQQGHYLVQRYSISYLTTGRDLLRMQVARASKSKPVVVADPAFGEPLTAQVASLERAKFLAKNTMPRRSITSADDLSSVYFAPLAGTAEEARTIKTLFPDANVFTGTNATKSVLKLVNAPNILHIATHGFFLTDGLQNVAAGANGKRAISARVRIENPLLRSGLALAGANLSRDSADNGILTALEASSLNLWGTRLVTLSACDTGVGEVKTGEGVYGLRRAFTLAGTETLVMSLWPVSDYVTREMMTSYYTGLKNGLGRGEALRQAELAMLKHKGRQHPFYWASFIQSGEWGNLQGKR
jgi:CHAT domain-containing protein/Tfp pilus assembly protein PilF